MLSIFFGEYEAKNYIFHHLDKLEFIDVSKCLSYTVPVIWTDFRQD